MEPFTQPSTIYFRNINLEKGRIFTGILALLGLFLAVVIDPLIFDLGQYLNQQVRLSHFGIAGISAISFIYIRWSKSSKRANLVLAIYLCLLSLIETYISGAIDTLDNRGPSVFIATIFLIGFIFPYTNRQFIYWFIVVYVFFIACAMNSGAIPNQMVSSIGNGTVFTFVIFIMRIYSHKQKVTEHENQIKVIEFIVKSNDRKGKSIPKNIVDKSDELLIQLEEYIVNQKHYLDVDITLSNVANEIGTNTKYLSQLINTIYKKNFNVFINDFRIAEAKRIMNHKLSDIITIEAISQQVGFKSKSSFYSAFKNATGLTPSDYLRQRSDK